MKLFEPTDIAEKANLAGAFKAIKALEAKAKDLPAGSYIIDETFRVRGTIKKGEGYSSETNAFPWKKMAIALANRVNELTLLKVVEDLGDDDKDMRPEVEEILEAIRVTTVRNCAGRVTGNVILEVEG